MTAKNYTSLLGVLLIIVGGMCPMLRVPIFGSWNYWDIDIVLATIIYTLCAIALLASVTRKQGLLHLSGWLLMLMLLFTITAVYFKVKDYFSFLILKNFAATAARMIKFQWLGWGLMFTGAFIIILTSRKDKVFAQTR